MEAHKTGVSKGTNKMLPNGMVAKVWRPWSKPKLQI